MIGIYIKMILALGVVLGLILAIGISLKRRRGKGVELIKILAYQSLGMKKGISVIKIGRELLVLGITSTDIRLLKTLNESEIESETVRDIAERVSALRTIKEGLLNADK